MRFGMPTMQNCLTEKMPKNEAAGGGIGFGARQRCEIPGGDYAWLARRGRTIKDRLNAPRALNPVVGKAKRCDTCVFLQEP